MGCEAFLRGVISLLPMYRPFWGTLNEIAASLPLLQMFCLQSLNPNYKFILQCSTSDADELLIDRHYQLCHKAIIVLLPKKNFLDFQNAAISIILL